MNLRKALLATMLWSLGLAAVAGVCAAVFGPGQTFRYVGTALATAVAAGLMLAFGKLIDRRTTRDAGLVGMAAITIEYLLGILLIWANFGLTSAVPFTMLALLQSAPPAMLFLALRDRKENDPARWIGLTTTVAGFCLVLIGIWLAPGTLDNWWWSSFVVAAFGLAAALSVVSVAISAWNWRWVGIVAALVSTIVCLVGIWTSAHSSWWFAVIAGPAAVAAHANLSFLCPLRPSQKWIRFVTILAVIAIALLIDVSAHDGYSTSDDTERALTAAGIVAGCGSLGLVVLTRVNRRPQSEESLPKSFTSVSIDCPHCSVKQTLPTGDSACANCGLRFHIRLEEPKCAGCGYLLYLLKSDRCPECGLPVQQAASSASIRGVSGTV